MYCMLDIAYTKVGPLFSIADISSNLFFNTVEKINSELKRWIDLPEDFILKERQKNVGALNLSDAHCTDEINFWQC